MSVTYTKLASRVLKTIENNQDLPQMTQQQLVTLMGQVFYQIADALASGEDVYLDRFGRFYPACKPPRKVNVPGIGKGETGYRIKVKFNAFKDLEETVKVYLQSLGLPLEEETKDAITALEERK